MKWEIMILIGIGIFVLVLGYVAVSKDTEEIMSKQLSISQQYAKSLNNSFQTRNGTSKTYLANESRVLIKNASTNETVLDLQLISEPIEWGIVAGVDQKVAEFWVSDYKNKSVSFFDLIQLYDAKAIKGSKSPTKQFKYKYGIDRQLCNDSGCDNVTTWTEFNNISDIPFKPIRVGLFTDTKSLERIEWIPVIQGFNITEWAVWDVSTANYDGNYTDTTVNFTGTLYDADIPNGSDVFILKQNNISRYSLSTPWNLNTSNYTGVSFNLTAQYGAGGNEGEVEFCNGGLNLYVTVSNSIYEYNMSQGYNISNLTYTGSSFSFSNQAPSGSGPVLALFVNSTCDGVFALGGTNNNRTIWKYTMTPHTLSTLTYTGDSYNITNITHSDSTTNPRGLRFKEDGTKFYITNQGTTDRVMQYTSSFTNISSSYYDVLNFSINGQETQTRFIYINQSGTRFYIGGSGVGKVFQYSMNDTSVGDCFATTANGDLYVPSGCTYYQPGSSYIG